MPKKLSHRDRLAKICKKLLDLSGGVNYVHEELTENFQVYTSGEKYFSFTIFGDEINVNHTHIGFKFSCNYSDKRVEEMILSVESEFKLAEKELKTRKSKASKLRLKNLKEEKILLEKEIKKMENL